MSADGLRWRTVAVGALVCVLLGVAIGRFGFRAVRVETRTVDHVVYQDRVVEKTVEVERKQKQDDRQLVKTIVEQREPSGAVRVETRVEYRDRLVEAQQREQTKERVEVQYVDRVVTEEKVVAPVLPRWSVGAGVGVDVFRLSPVYQADVAYRLAGPFSLAAWAQVRQADLAPTVGVGVRVAF
jgi:hypothetical protein